MMLRGHHCSQKAGLSAQRSRESQANSWIGKIVVWLSFFVGFVGLFSTFHALTYVSLAMLAQDRLYDARQYHPFYQDTRSQMTAKRIAHPPMIPSVLPHPVSRPFAVGA